MEVRIGRNAWIGALMLMLATAGSGPAFAAAAVAVTIEPAAEPGEFVAAASVRDLATEVIVATPTVAVRSGARAEASLEGDRGGQSTVRFEVGVDATATRATWRLEWRRGGRLEALSEGNVTLERPEHEAY